MTERRRSKPNAKCSKTGKSTSECGCAVCAICLACMDDDIACNHCSTGSCKAPFSVHRSCVQQQLLSKRKLHIRCTGCEKTTNFERKRTPIWRVRCCNLNLLRVLQVTALLFVLALTPQLLAWLTGKESMVDNHPWYVQAIGSWIIYAVLFSGLAFVWYTAEFFTRPLRKLFALTRSYVSQFFTEETAEDVDIIAYAT